MKIFRAVLLNILSIFLVIALQYKLSEIPLLRNYIPEALSSAPPIGKFLDPFNGFWANAEAKTMPKKQSLQLIGLKKNVEILIDQRAVPHIFAENDEDLYFAQGYITASYRLWQMEFLTHFSAGRLSEFLGEQAVEIDRSQRRIGLALSAEKALYHISKDSTSSAILNAYTKGVNAYIQNLATHEFPLEYKILDYKPEPWTNLKTALLLKYMAYDLSAAGNDDFANTMTASKFGLQKADSLYTQNPFQKQAVIPRTTTLNFKPSKPITKPKHYDSVTNVLAKNLAETQKILKEQVKVSDKEKAKGSNNWVIDGKKSETGYPILANDPHLSLKLPSIWFEIQLNSPTTNVYGVSLPGAPAVIIGFNEKIAWGITNAYTDALDFYQIKFKDETLEEYWHDGNWKKTTLRKEIIKVKHQKEVVEYIRHTHQGAIVLEKPSRMYPNQPNDLYEITVPYRSAMYWLGNDSTSNELLAFHKLNRAANYQDFLNAMSTFGTPSSCIAYADTDKNIAMYVAGKIPMRWEGQGKYILDGTNSQYEYKHLIAHTQNPQALNPEQHFLASANQHITDSLQYPYYVGYDFVSPERAIRINQRLSEMSRIKYENVRELQNDVFAVHASKALPLMLQKLDTISLQKDKISTHIYQTLKKWNYLYQADAQGATFFEVWFGEFRKALWQDELAWIPNYPNTDQTMRILLKDSTSYWVDDKSTPQKENIGFLINESYKKAIQQLKSKHKDKDENWAWGKYKNFHLDHLLIPNLGLKDLATSGSVRTINATSDDHGPSWRMIVVLGANTPKAYGIYPGGQSGNPGSFYYANMVESWRIGELEELIFLKKNTKDKQVKIQTSIQLKKKETDGLIR
ncbi:MAG: penicillin acylase family protein [Thermonemataceae bacterium]|nr:penicillin acylase family protein [Thermonemataceae bacterium]